MPSFSCFTSNSTIADVIIRVPYICRDSSVHMVGSHKNQVSVMVFRAAATDRSTMPPVMLSHDTRVASTLYLILTKLFRWIREKHAPGTSVFVQTQAPASNSVKNLYQELEKADFGPKNLSSSPNCNPLPYTSHSGKFHVRLCAKHPRTGRN